MAISAQVVRSDAFNVKMVEKACEIAVDASGDGSLIVNLDDTFLNSPHMTVVPPIGTDSDTTPATYTAAYDSATPKITITIDQEIIDLVSTTVRCILLAYDQP